MDEQKPEAVSEGIVGQSASTGWLEVATSTMTNDELAAAIAYAFERCNQTYVGGYCTSTTEAGKVMLEHLKKLLTVQRVRAGMVTTANV